MADLALAPPLRRALRSELAPDPLREPLAREVAESFAFGRWRRR
jgi:hypothetical protein